MLRLELNYGYVVGFEKNGQIKGEFATKFNSV